MNQIAESRLSNLGARMTGLDASLGRMLLRAPETLNLWYERSRQRRQLARMDDRLLRDIGVDRASAMEEASKPFWQI
jgi:uncharacterized protein YjiS (DUF1127 family)